MKKCSGCGEVKSLDDFHIKRGNKKDGRFPKCKDCWNKQVKEKYKTIPREYNVWKSMKRRCNNKNSPNYDRYGGRGISVCKEWESFENFLRSMGPRPSDKHSIDRIDNNGNYEKENCRWATRAEQSQNTITTKLTPCDVVCIRILSANGYGYKRLSRIFGMHHSNISAVIKKKAWKEIDWSVCN